MVMSNGGQAPHARRSLDTFFTESVRKHPDRPALYVAERLWSYSEFDAQCRSVERSLAAASNQSKGRNVGVVYSKSVLSYAAVIAIMRSGNVYVPLNPKQPVGRLLKILEDADVETLIVDAGENLSDGVRGALLRSRPLQIVVKETRQCPSLDAVLNSTAQHRLHRIAELERSEYSTDVVFHNGADLDGTDLSYIIYTSGSTGVPKGVAVTRENACRCIEKLHEMFETNEDDRFTQFSALSFDVSIADLFLCWKSGGTLYVPEHSEELVPLRFAVTHEITVWSSVPSIANFLMKLGLLTPAALPEIRLSFFAGEALPGDLARAWSVAASRSRVFNIYGPTECTIFSTYYEFQSQPGGYNGVVPIGVPLPGLRHLIMDEGQVVEHDDVPGELWLSGDQVAFGYWNNPAATRRAFVRFPEDGPTAAVWYRTGDLVSRRKGTGLTFRGRLDRQVKLRGYRVELQEVESALRDVAGCALAAVVPVCNAGGICEKIVAYCDSLQVDEMTLKARCLARLPEYMVPERIFQLESFPLSDHGKIDYIALAARAERRSK